MLKNTERKYVDPMDEWNELMKNILGKEKWESLTYWQKMCEIAALQQWRIDNKNWIAGLFGM